MNLETKYNINDRVWLMYDNKPLECAINSILVNRYLQIFYTLIGLAHVHKEQHLFLTKQDLLNSL